MQKLSDFVVDYLSNYGIENIFMLPGGGCMHLIDSVGRHEKIKYTINLHEQACAIAAEAYAQYKNDIGVALVTTGPGSTNTLTGVASAWLDSIPLLIISGQVKRDDITGNRKVRQMGFQEINILEIVKPITKYAVTVMEPEMIKFELQKAIQIAKSGRPGPVWIDIPQDVQATMIDENKLKSFDRNLETGSWKPDADDKLLKEQVKEVIDLLNKSERPVILAGNGIRLSSGLNEFLNLIYKLNIPVLTTWKAIDFLSEDDDLFIGRPGGVGQRGANFAQQNSDFILIIGARLDLGQTGYMHKNFARGAKKVMVDADVNEINKMQMKIDVPVCSDATLFIDEFLNQISSLKSMDTSAWLNRCREWKKKFPVILKEYYEQKDFVNDYVLIDILSNELTAEDILIPGSSGACSERSMQAFKVKKGQRIFNSEGLGSMGFGISAAIGGCIASGKKKTICIEGDGGFSMNLQELETLRRLDLPVKLFILNNKGYVSMRITQRTFFNGKFTGCGPDSGLTLPDFCNVADAFKIKSFRLNNNQEIKENIKQILNFKGPVLCDVMVNPDMVTAPRIVSIQKEDGKMVSKPMEDMFPFLDREEFKANMIIEPLEE